MSACCRGESAGYCGDTPPAPVEVTFPVTTDAHLALAQGLLVDPDSGELVA